MRTIKPTNSFKRDLRKIIFSPRYKDITPLLKAVTERLAAEETLPASNRDHALSGDWINHRECHIRPDMLLIYRKQGTDLLQLVRLGSHSELFR